MNFSNIIPKCGLQKFFTASPNTSPPKPVPTNQVSAFNEVLNVLLIPPPLLTGKSSLIILTDCFDYQAAQSLALSSVFQFQEGKCSVINFSFT